MVEVHEEKTVVRDEFVVDNSEVYYENRHWYLEKYGVDIDPPNLDLKFTIIIPTFAELESDNFWRLVRSLVYQRGVRQTEYDVICVINNSDSLAELSNGEVHNSHPFEGSTGEVRKKRFQENQDQILIIRTMQYGQRLIGSGVGLEEVVNLMEAEMQENGVRITDHELSLIKRFVKSKVKLQCIDASSLSRGFVDDVNVSPISLARDIGSFIAQDRFNQNLGRPGMVDFLDGDCFIDPNYASNMIKALEAGSLVVAKPLKKLILEIPKSIEEANETRYMKIVSTLRYLLTSLSGGIDYYMDIVNHFDFDSKKWNVSLQLGGPQLALRSDCFAQINGYPTGKYNGDWDFSRNVVKEYQGDKITTFQRSRVLMSDRGRDVSIDGNGRGELTGYNDGKLGRDPSWSYSTRNKLSALKKEEEILKKNIHEIELLGWAKSQDLLDEFCELKRKIYEHDAKTRELTIEKTNRLLSVVLEMDFLSMSSAELVERAYVTNLIREMDRDYFEENQTLVDLAVEVLKLSKENSTNDFYALALAKMRLIELLPEYFEAPPSKTPDIQEMTQESNLGNYMYLVEAIYLMKAKMRDRFIGRS